MRGDGTHQYHFANDLVWAGGPGYYIVRNRDTTVGVQFVASGEYKDVDRFRGKRAEDTGITSVFLGPRLVVSRGRFSAEVAGEIPVREYHARHRDGERQRHRGARCQYRKPAHRS